MGVPLQILVIVPTRLYIGSIVELVLVIMQELVAELLMIPKLDVDNGRLAMR